MFNKNWVFLSTLFLHVIAVWRVASGEQQKKAIHLKKPIKFFFRCLFRVTDIEFLHTVDVTINCRFLKSVLFVMIFYMTYQHRVSVICHLCNINVHIYPLTETRQTKEKQNDNNLRASNKFPRRNSLYLFMKQLEKNQSPLESFNKMISYE